MQLSCWLYLQYFATIQIINLNFISQTIRSKFISDSQSKRWSDAYYLWTKPLLALGSQVTERQSGNAERVGEGERLLSLRHPQVDQDSLFATDGDSSGPQGNNLRCVHPQGAAGQISPGRARRQQTDTQTVPHHQKAAEREASGRQRPAPHSVSRLRHSVRQHPHARHAPAQVTPPQRHPTDFLAMNSREL